MLYVSQRTSSGFYVHESGVGGSTVAFDYRIVGKRYMPVVPAVHITMNAPKIPPVIPTFQAVPKQRPIIPH
jgi:hypothetical protein